MMMTSKIKMTSKMKGTKKSEDDLRNGDAIKMKIEKLPEILFDDFSPWQPHHN